MGKHLKVTKGVSIGDALRIGGEGMPMGGEIEVLEIVGFDTCLEKLRAGFAFVSLLLLR